MDIEVEGCGGGCGVLELSVVQAVTVLTFKREKIKDRKCKRKMGGLSSVWEASRYLQCVLMLSTVARHTFPSLFPLVLVKLNGHCFKNTALSETPLKLSLPFSVQLLFSSDEFYVSFWLKHYRGAFRERLV